MTSCSMESFGSVKPFCTKMLWPGPKPSFSSGPLCSLLETSVGRGMQCPTSPPHLSPRHLFCGEEIFFLLLLAPVYQYQQTQGSLCSLPCLMVGSQYCIIQNIHSAFLAGLSDPLFTLTFASSSWGRNRKFSPVHSSSFSSIPKHFSWNFHLCELATSL